MTIIKDAFKEGRNTDVTWENSETLKKFELSQMTENNISIFTDSLEKYKSKKISQYDTVTGEKLRTFSSISEASRWLMDFHNKKKSHSKVYQMNGNLRMSMMLGYSSYGFYWKIHSHKSNVKADGDLMDFSYDKSKIKTSRKTRKNDPYIVVDSDGTVTKHKSITSISNETGLSKLRVSRLLNDKGFGVEIDQFTIHNYASYHR